MIAVRNGVTLVQKKAGSAVPGGRAAEVPVGPVCGSVAR
jgi:hypothetical protein